MPPKASTRKAAAPKASEPKKAAAATTTKKATAKTATKAAPAKAAATKKTAAATTTSAPKSRKRKADDDEDKENEDAPKAKKAKTPAASKRKVSEEVESEEEEKKPAKQSKAEKPQKPVKAAAPKKVVAPKHPHTIGASINIAPTKILDVYVFGDGSGGELGLGSDKVDGKKPRNVKRPRINKNLSSDKVGVVQIDAGAMHVVALTHDNKILTWGVNDHAALGRDTTWDGGLRDVDDESDGEEEDKMNPRESTPAAVDPEHFAPGVVFTQVIASDNATFALTEDGRVYGWGTFRNNDGIHGFTQEVKVARDPMFLPELKKIKYLAAGSNHVLALDNKGLIWSWGCGQQNQLGRRIIERNAMSSLAPGGLGLPKKTKIEKVACGDYHSLALTTDGKVLAWGLNNYGEAGIREGAGDAEAVLLRPILVEALEDHKVTDIDGGQHHSIACNSKGELLTWGRFDGHQVGLTESQVNEDDLMRDEAGRARILVAPTVVPGISKVNSVTAGPDNNFAITSDGQAYSWGFSASFQTGQGEVEDDEVEVPTLIDNTAVRGKKLVHAGAGAQYSLLCGLPSEQVNGTS